MKNCKLKFLKPQFAGHLEKLRGLPTSPNWTHFNFLINFLLKSKFKGDRFYEKFADSYFVAHFAGCFGGLPIGPQWSNSKFLKQL